MSTQPDPGPSPVARFTPGGPTRFRHQRKGLRDAIENRGVHALLFDPGVGKTAVALDYASLLALKAPSGEARVLVVAPLAAVDTWVTQAQTFVAQGINVWAEAIGGSITQRADTLAVRGGNPMPGSPSLRGPRGARSAGYRRAHALALRPARGTAVRPAEGPDGLGRAAPRLVLCTVNLDSFSSRARAKGSRTMADLMVEAVRRFRPDLIVVDESHRIKSPTSNTSKAMARLTPLCRRRLLLTGTVMPHSPLDVFGQWRFLDPSAFSVGKYADGSPRPATFSGFRERFAVMGGFMGREVLGFRRLDEMQAIMARNSTVARKVDVLDLPPVTEVIVPVHLSRTEALTYERMRRDLAVAFASGALATVPNRLAQMMRLRQITSGYLPDDLGLVQAIGNSKAMVIRSLVQDTLAGESRVVVFAHFRYEIEALKDVLAQRGTEVVSITGSTHSHERAAIRSRFGSLDPARIVLVAQTKTMSLAINELVTASHVVFGSLSNQRDDIEQAIARLDRQGQTKPVTVWITSAPGTVDEVLWKSYKDRTNLEAALLRHISESPTRGEA